MSREVSILKYGYRFKQYDIGRTDPQSVMVAFDDSEWATVRVPHDWAITGVFDEKHDPRERHKPTADGLPVIYTGTTGGLPTVGEGVYRLWIEVPPDAADKDITLEFDGVMWQSTVYCNGKKVGGCHFGYQSFEVDVTDFVRCGESNLIAVHVVLKENCGRWYSGAGIFRNVRLVYKNKKHIAYHGVWLRQLAVGKECAIFEANVDAVGGDGCKKSVTVYDRSGQSVCSIEFTGDCDLFTVPHPALWDVTDPAMYRAEVTLYDEDRGVVDTVTVKFGIRVSEFTRDGYFLNGRRLKIQGVCMHHDLGSLGAAVNVAALRRQIAILKEMGVNSIRTSHNPPTPELLDLCDENGILVMDEFFDEWLEPKVKNGYANDFAEHAVQDVRDVIKRDRNHPCVILWSIGNEIGEQMLPDGWRIAKLLAEATKAADPTRQVTFGLNNHMSALAHHLVHYVDVVGLNYKPRSYREWHEQFPDMILLGSETASCVSTRDVYHFPACVDQPATQYGDLTASAYELSSQSWAYYAERELAAQVDCPFVAGEYVWTGFDYLGEPTPYLNKWPSRSSYFGAVDLAGLKKNRFYLYQSAWTNETVLHVFPHWTWNGREGKNVPVHVFTNLPKAELFVNGESQGERTHESTNEIDRFRMRWDDVIYQPGQIKVIGYDFCGDPVAEKVIKTAGEAHRVELSCDRDVIAADGDDLCYVTATVVDKDGTPCMKEQRLTFSVSGNVEFLTTDAGDQRETESFYRPDKMTLGSRLVACVRSIKGVTGEVTINCGGEGLITGSITIMTK